MRLNLTLRIRGKMYHLHFQSMSIPLAKTTGLSARVPYSSHFVTFLDYDNVKDEVLEVHELPFLQELFHLGDFHVFKTSEFARHAICVDRLSLREVLEILDNSSCDSVFKKGIRFNEYRTWILRAIEKGNRPKPKFLYTIKSPHNGRRLQSQAHALFLKHYYGAEVRLIHSDGNYVLEVQGYKTGHRIDMNEAHKDAHMVRST